MRKDNFGERPTSANAQRNVAGGLHMSSDFQLAGSLLVRSTLHKLQCMC